MRNLYKGGWSFIRYAGNLAVNRVSIGIYKKGEERILVLENDARQKGDALHLKKLTVEQYNNFNENSVEGIQEFYAAKKLILGEEREWRNGEHWEYLCKQTHIGSCVK